MGVHVYWPEVRSSVRGSFPEPFSSMSAPEGSLQTGVDHVFVYCV